MKKHTMNLSKRLLASTLALAMCLGMTCTTAFAANDNQENVYVYVGVDVVDVSNVPEFEGKLDVTDEEKAALKELEDNVKHGGETADRAYDNIPETKPDFDAGEELQDAVDRAATEVAERLEALENNGTTPKPEYAAPETDKPTEPAETSETKAPAFDAKDVNNRVDALNKAQEETDKVVSEAQKEADKTLGELNAEEAEVLKTLEEEKGKLEEAKSDAEEKVTAANQAVTDCETKQAELKADFEKQIADLAETKPDDTFRERREDESEADYVAAQNAWVQEHEDYNAKVDEINKALEAAQADLKVQSDAAKQAVLDAQAALDKASDDLTAYNKLAEGEFDKLAEKNQDIKDHNEKLGNYNSAVEKYGENAVDYNNAAGAYENAVKDYDKAADAYNKTEVKNYNDNVDKYNTEAGYYNADVAKYNEAADAYNKKVGNYNEEAAKWNTGKAQVDMLDNSALADELKNLSLDNITVEQASDLLKTDVKNAWAEMSDEEYNKQVEEYNKVVDAYNKAVQKYNEALETNKDDVIKNVVSNYIDGQELWTTPAQAGGSETHWYALGKINVQGSGFAENPGNFATNDGMSHDYNNYNGTYVWEKDGNGNVTGTALDSTKINLVEGSLGEKDAFKNFTNKLSDASEEKGTFTKDQLKGDYQDLMNNGINKWVLTVADGANSGTGKEQDAYVPSGTPAWHLNGYLHVSKLSQLAKLETRAVQAKEKELIDDKDKAQEVKLKGPVTLTTAEKYDYYAPTLEIDTTAPREDWEKRPAHPNDYEGAALDVNVPNRVDVPDEITVTPDPTEPEVPTEPDEPDTPVVDVPEPDVPLVEAPEIEIPEPEVPLAEEPVVDIPEEEVPLIEAPEEVEIPEEDVPLADVPKTGDISAMWHAVTLLSACGLAILALRRKENG